MKKKISVCIVVAIVVAAGVFAATKFLGNKKNEQVAEATVKSDFYEATNKELINNLELKSDEPYAGVFGTKTQDKVDENVKEIIKDIVSKDGEYAEGTVEYNICQLYNSMINRKDETEKFKKYMELIDNSQNMNELMNNMKSIKDSIGFSCLINFGLDRDFNDKTKINVYLSNMNFDYSQTAPEFYTANEYVAITGLFGEYNKKFLTQYGYSEEEAEKTANDVNNFYSKIAKSTKSMEEQNSVENAYEIVSYDELKQIFSNIDIDLFLGDYKGKYEIGIVDKEQAKALNNFLTEDNFETIREYARLQLLQNYAQVINMDFYDLILEFNATLNGTEKSTDTLEDNAIDIVTSYFDTTISKKYVEKYADDEKIMSFEGLVDDILNQYKTKIESNDWLTEETKKKALTKLNNMKVHVGYPDEWKNDEENLNFGESLFDNVVNYIKTEKEYKEKVLISGKTYWPMSILVVNAFYSSDDNSINFPLAALECELYSKDNSYYQNIGALGAVVGHEITHAFDNNGALFDENGNMTNWWTDEDYSKFEELQNKVAEYYSEYQIEGLNVSGSLTVGENIADLGAVSCITEIAESRGATQQDFEDLYKAYANVWASKSTKEYIRNQILNDTHAPDKIRTNAVLSSIDKFYEVFGIEEGDGMYKAPDKRVKVW